MNDIRAKRTVCLNWCLKSCTFNGQSYISANNQKHVYFN